MDQSVMIKGLNHGIVVVLDSAVDYETLKEKTAKRFRESAKFLGNAEVAISFEGKELSEDQKKDLLNVITSESNLSVVCILENDPVKDAIMKAAVESMSNVKSNLNGLFYKGNLRSGQEVSSEENLVIIGDVNPGASVTARGSIIVLGSLRGTVIAGSEGNENAFVLALDMSPVQIRIAETIARAPDNPVRNEFKEPRIAFLENGNIYIEPVNRKILSEREL